MNCQECEVRPATLHFTKIINGEKTELHLCESCAREKGEIIPGGSNGFSIQNLLSGILHFDPFQNAIGQGQAAQVARCDTCGLTFTQFSKMGRFGCSECYKSFHHRLEPLFKRIHGNTTHSGKVPVRAGGTITLKKDILKLKEELQKRIINEEFEKAAEVRDKIRRLEQQLNNQL